MTHLAGIRLTALSLTVAALTTITANGSASAQTSDDVLARLAALERQVSKLQDENALLRKQARAQSAKPSAQTSAAAREAYAADMAAPVYKASAPAFAQVYNWTGLYVGVHAGYGASKIDWTNVINPLSGSFRDQTAEGLIGGAQIGYNWQSANWVFGVEGDWSWMDRSGETLLNGATSTSTVKWIATATARVGYTWGPGLIYVKGGGAWAHNEYDLTFANGPELGASETKSGWTIGGGLEYAIAPNWTAKLEYSYLDLGDDIHRMTGIAGESDPVRIEQTIQAVKFGLNYRFGDYGKAPVVAKY